MIHENTNTYHSPSISDYHKKGMLANKMGHAFGLDHLSYAQLYGTYAIGYTNEDVVMLQMQQNRTINQADMMMYRELITYIRNSGGEKMKFKVLSAVLIISLFTITGCSATKSANDSGNSNTAITTKVKNSAVDYSMNVIRNNQVSASNVVSISKITADKTSNYDVNNINNLIDAADNIFNGTVEDISYFDKGGSTYSILEVKINKVFYGNISKGDIVNVIEFGGYTTVYNRMLQYGENDKEFVGITKEEAKNKYVEINYENCPLAKIGEEAIFLAKSGFEKSLKLKFPAYEIGSGKERKLVIDGNKVERKGDATLDKLTIDKADYEKKIDEKVKIIKMK